MREYPTNAVGERQLLNRMLNKLEILLQREILKIRSVGEFTTAKEFHLV
jgi:hypothetical protein